MSAASRLTSLGTYAVAAIAAAGLLLFAVSAVLSFRTQLAVDAKLCATTVVNRMATRASWLALQRLALANIQADEETTPEEKAEKTERTQKFVDAVLRPIPALKCVDNQPVPVGPQP